MNILFCMSVINLLYYDGLPLITLSMYETDMALRKGNGSKTMFAFIRLLDMLGGLPSDIYSDVFPNYSSYVCMRASMDSDGFLFMGPFGISLSTVLSFSLFYGSGSGSQGASLGVFLAQPFTFDLGSGWYLCNCFFSCVMLPIALPP